MADHSFRSSKERKGKTDCLEAIRFANEINVPVLAKRQNVTLFEPRAEQKREKQRIKNVVI